MITWLFLWSYQIFFAFISFILSSGFAPPKIKRVSLNGADPGDIYSSSEKAKKILRWNPRYNLGRGLAETFKWYNISGIVR